MNGFATVLLQTNVKYLHIGKKHQLLEGEAIVGFHRPALCEFSIYALKKKKKEKKRGKGRWKCCRIRKKKKQKPNIAKKFLRWAYS